MPHKDGSTKTKESGITRLVHGSGTSYRVRISAINARTGERQIVSKNFDTFADARDFKRKTIHELRSGVYQEPSTEPLASVLAHWLETANLADNSRKAYGGVIDRIVVPALGTVQLGRLSGRQVQELYNEPRSQSYAVQVQAVVHGALALAVREGLIATNVAEGLRAARRDEEKIERPIWTADELAVFLADMETHRLGMLFTVAAYTGLRISELTNLRWSDVSLDLGRLFVRKAKTSAGVRRVALDPETVARLRRHNAEQEQRRMDAGDLWQGEDYVFDRGDGRRVSVRTAESVMEAAVKRLKLPYISVHGLRHVHATHLIRAGVPLHVVQRRLGHASAATTATIYAHALPADEADAAAAFAKAVRPHLDIEPNSVRKTASE